MPALGWPRAPQSSFLMRPGKGVSCTGTATSSVTCPRPRCGRSRPCSRRSTPARTSRQHARKPSEWIEKLRGLRLSRAAELVEAAVEETLTRRAERDRVSPHVQARARRHRIEASWLALPFWALARLGGVAKTVIQQGTYDIWQVF